MLNATRPDGAFHIVQSPTSSDGDGPPRPSDEVMTAVADAEVYFGFGIPRDLFVAAPRLRWVHSAAAGVGSALHEEMRRSDVVLTNSAGVHAIPIAEYAVAGILHFLRGFDVAIAQQRRASGTRRSSSPPMHRCARWIRCAPSSSAPDGREADVRQPLVGGLEPVALLPQLAGRVVERPHALVCARRRREGKHGRREH